MKHFFPSLLKKLTKRGFRLETNKSLIALGIILLGGLGGWVLVGAKPETKRVAPPVSSPLVTVSSVTPESIDLSIKALGMVRAAQKTLVRARVSGEVLTMGAKFEVGALINLGELVLQLDTETYKNTLAIKEANLVKAVASGELEKGQQRAARLGLKLFEENGSSTAGRDLSLVLRNPQAAQAQATIKSAEAEANQARFELDKTKIAAPFNALVVERHISLGSLVNAGDSIALLVGTDEYHIEAAIALDKLHALGLKAFDGSVAKVYSAAGVQREGRVLHTIASMDATTRMARVLIAVPDPLGLSGDEAAMILGDHVRVELSAGRLDDVIRLPRAVLRENDTVWVARPHDENRYTLDIRTVTVAWKDAEKVIISGGLAPGEKVITSNLGAALAGMALLIE